MSIKWEDVKVRTTMLTNSIVLGKTKKDKNGFEYFVDKSKDKTDEILLAVCEHLLNELKDGKDTGGYRWEGLCELTIKDLRNKEK